MQHVCTKCEKIFYSKNTLPYHKKREHWPVSGNNELTCKPTFLPRSIVCCISTRWLCTRWWIRRNLLIHECTSCDKILLENTVWSVTSSIITEKQRNGLYCKLCSVTFVSFVVQIAREEYSFLKGGNWCLFRNYWAYFPPTWMQVLQWRMSHTKYPKLSLV